MKLICALSLVMMDMIIGTSAASIQQANPTTAQKQAIEELESGMIVDPEVPEDPRSTSSLLKLALLNELVKQEVNCTHPCTKFMTQEQQEKLRSILLKSIGHPVKDSAATNEMLLMCALTREFQREKTSNSKLQLLRKVIMEAIKKKVMAGDINKDIKDVLIEALARDIKTEKTSDGAAPASFLGDLGISLLGELKVILQNQTIIVNNSAPVGSINLDQSTVMQSVNAGQGGGAGPGGSYSNVEANQETRVDKDFPICDPYAHFYRSDCTPSCSPWDYACQMSQSRARFEHKLSQKVIRHVNDVYDSFTGSFFGEEAEEDDENDAFRYRSLLESLDESNDADFSLETRSGISGPKLRSVPATVKNKNKTEKSSLPPSVDKVSPPNDDVCHSL